MKRILSILAMTLGFQAAHSAEILAGRLSEDRSMIELDVKYGGGCETHEFALELGACAESMPVQCRAKLMHDSNGDLCEALVHRTISFSLEQYGLTEAYFSEASFTISGDGETSATIALPAQK